MPGTHILRRLRPFGPANFQETVTAYDDFFALEWTNLTTYGTYIEQQTHAGILQYAFPPEALTVLQMAGASLRTTMDTLVELVQHILGTAEYPDYKTWMPYDDGVWERLFARVVADTLPHLRAVEAQIDDLSLIRELVFVPGIPAWEVDDHLRLYETMAAERLPRLHALYDADALDILFSQLE